MKTWNELPANMQNEEVKKYYDILNKHRMDLLVKRIFDVLISTILLIVLSPVMCILSIWVKLGSKGAIFFRQTRVTRYGRLFTIWKFRTMVSDAEQLGSQVTTSNDLRITKQGKFLRKSRLDELPQLFNILVGDMSFVGTRPEVPKYVEKYTPEMLATLLLPAGVTSEASIKYKDEEKLLSGEGNPDDIYVTQILPEKMAYNLENIRTFNFVHEIKTMIRTIIAVAKRG